MRNSCRRDDLLGLLAAAQDDDGALSEDELPGNLVLLFIAGHETTTNLIGNGLSTLLRHPTELQRLRACAPESAGLAKPCASPDVAVRGQLKPARENRRRAALAQRRG